MKVVSTRDLAHRAARVSRALKLGKTLLWASRGRLIARLVPAQKKVVPASSHWLERARKAGAVLRRKPLASTIVSDSRD